MTTLVAIVLLLAANAFFVAAEFALVRVRALRLDELADRGSRRARLAKAILPQLEAYLAACQLGITMASLGLGWVGEPFVAALLEPLFALLGLGDRLLHTVSFLVGFLLFSALHIVVGEQVPKTLAIRRAEPVTLWVALPLEIFYRAVYPLNWALNAASRRLLRLFRVAEMGEGEIVSRGELEGLIGLSRRHGAVAKHEHDMLGAVLELAEVEVGSVMTHRRDMVTLDADLPLPELLRQIRTSRYTRFPVWRGDPDQIVGILDTKSLVGLLDERGRLPEGIKLDDLLTPPWFIPDTTALYQQLLAFRQRRQHLALVVDEYGTLMGLVTLEDIVEEIVGDIADERDHESQGIALDAEGRAVVDGRTAVRDLNRQLDWALPEDEAVTIGGLVMHVARRIPREGEVVSVAGYAVKVLERRRHHLVRLEIRPPAAGAAES
ncbi:MAG: hemolysin family protein [Geminicoccaceae bacterium]|nr:hemolysin family protein [Geminicoccaceae bacterium]MCX8100806.1 hemolysin family protein [Geminicoccaceae bacterium]MDW8370045.1 hemolysin family protein [Geminicoccaceae bacterium]